jgi:hypothetical protein
VGRAEQLAVEQLRVTPRASSAPTSAQIELGADVHAEDTRRLRAVHWAATGNAATVDLLVAQGALEGLAAAHTDMAKVEALTVPHAPFCSERRFQLTQPSTCGLSERLSGGSIVMMGQFASLPHSPVAFQP